MQKPAVIRFETKTTISGITLTIQTGDSVRIKTRRFRSYDYCSALAQVQACIEQTVRIAQDEITDRAIQVFLNGEPWSPPPAKPAASEIKRVILAVLDGKPNAIDGLRDLYDRL